MEVQDGEREKNKVIDKKIFIQQLQTRALDLTYQNLVLRSTIFSNRLKGEALTRDKNTANAPIKKRSTRCAPNNTDEKKLVFIERELEPKQKIIKELESLLDARCAPRKQVKGIILINLETLKRQKKISFSVNKKTIDLSG